MVRAYRGSKGTCTVRWEDPRRTSREAPWVTAPVPTEPAGHAVSREDVTQAAAGPSSTPPQKVWRRPRNTAPQLPGALSCANAPVLP